MSVCLYIDVSELQGAIIARSSRDRPTLFVLADVLSSHEFASQFSVAFFYMRKTSTNYRENRHSPKCMLNEPASDPSKRCGNAGYGRSIASDRQQRERSTAVIAASD